MFSLFDGMLKYARSVVERVKRDIDKQLDTITEDVLAPIIGDMAPLRDSWKGQGATRFFDEMDNIVIKEIYSIVSSAGDYSSTISKAIDLIEQSDSTAFNIVSELVDTFDFF